MTGQDLRAARRDLLLRHSRVDPKKKTTAENKTMRGDAVKIAKRSEDFSGWYQDVVREAELAEHGPARGSMTIKPYGYAIWENIQRVLDDMFKARGIQNAYFPLLIPENILKKESAHFDGFRPELTVATHGGGNELEEPLVIRPTSEAIVWDSFSRWIRSYHDLPLQVNQWANVARWEKKSELFLRNSEFLWQEGHTAHVDTESARNCALEIVCDVYQRLAEQHLAIPVCEGRKADVERFPGAEETYCIEALMQDGKSLQAGTAHYFADRFSKAFDVGYLDRDGKRQNVFQTSWGVSTRLIGGLIMTHGDDLGLVLPPKIAPVQVVVIPATPASLPDGMETFEALLPGLVVRVDQRFDLSVGERHGIWERKGVPVRIELEPDDLARNRCCLTRRDTGEKTVLNLDQLEGAMTTLLDRIQQRLFSSALDRRRNSERVVDDWREFSQGIESGGYVFAHWCERDECQSEIKRKTGAITRFQPLKAKTEDGDRLCIECRKKSPSRKRWAFARAY